MEVRAPEIDALVVMSAREVEAAAQHIDVVYRQAVATHAVMLQRVDAVSGFVEDGHRNIGAWARSTHNWSNAEAARMAKLARAMRAMPNFQAACLAGLIGVPQMFAIAQTASNPRVAEHLAGADDLFTNAAQDLPFDDLAILLRHWEELADQDGARSGHDRAVRDRHARLSFVGARAYLDAAGPAHDGLSFETVLAHYTDLEWTLEWERLAAFHGDAMHAGLMERTPAQRSFDALQKIFDAAASTQTGNGLKPTVNIVIDQATFEHELAKIAGEQPAPLDPNLHAATRRCEDMNGHVLDPHHVTVMSLTERVRRIVIGADNVITNMGRRQRLFTGAARDAVLLAHRRCTRPGCNVPGSRCEADHLDPHGHGGVTDVDNGAPACGTHNRHRNNGYRTVRDAKGLYHTLRPDGSEVGWPTYRANTHDVLRFTVKPFPQPDRSPPGPAP